MNENWNPEIPLNLQQNFKKEKEQAFTLYTLKRPISLVFITYLFSPS